MSLQKYDPAKIEPKWQQKWTKLAFYKAEDFSKKKKFYLLVEFPYPSGDGLHTGHIREYAAIDAYARKKRMEDYNVLYPIGWDAFGLPAENYAIKTGIHPTITVKKNIKKFREQMKSLGLSFDWTREIDTTDPNYYKWTQWIFIQLFKNGLAYQKEVPVNWCPFCKTNLADEEVLADGRHERCGNLTEKRLQKQWLLKITRYADRLVDDLKLVDFSPKIATQQINWIGRSEGIIIDYPLVNKKGFVSCYSTRPDTNFGTTFIVIAPEHPRLAELTTSENKKTVEEYVKNTKKKSESDRLNEGKEKTGVFTGSYALNRVCGRKLPIWVSDFAILGSGTGMVVGVPAHDKRDWEFAKKYHLDIVPVIKPLGNKSWNYDEAPYLDIDQAEVFNSDFLNGLPALKAKDKIIEYLVDKGWGRKTFNYHLHDWIFSRQHYWGEPIPMIFCQNCAKEGKSWFTKAPKSQRNKEQFENWNPAGWYSVPEEDLPLKLPYLEKYQPSGTGESPLSNVPEWVNTVCPACGGEARRETDTMPNWAGSNWYFVRYIDPKNDKELASKKLMDYWLPVDLYQGGFEHTTLHLLYSRFIYKFLYDIKAVPNPEPYMKRRSHGIVLGADGRKMSKSFGNVVNPDEIVAKYGADTLRLYEAFMGPFDQAISWSEESLEGCFRFLNRVWRVVNEKTGEKSSKELKIKLHQTIKKVGNDIENMKFNIGVAAMMEFVNAWEDNGSLDREDTGLFLRILAPMAPHITEELWQKVVRPPAESWSIHSQSWPSYDPKLIVKENVIIVVQVNGKVRSQEIVNREQSQDQSEIEKLAKSDPKIAKWIEGKSVKNTIFVPGKLINFVVS